MPEAFFIPVDPVRFFEENDLGESFVAPSPVPEGGLRFDGQCMGCGATTSKQVTLVGGTRRGSGGEAAQWEQPVPMCDGCVALRARRDSLDRQLRIAAFVGTAVLIAPAWWLLPWSLMFKGLAVLVLGLLVNLVLRAALVSWVRPRLLERVEVNGSALASCRAVELFYFRDPRKGEDARFLCLRIENDERAAAFGALNHHAIPAAAWDASYTRAGREVT